MSKLHIIFDDRRIERYHPLMDGLEEQGITDFELHPCTVLPDVVASINASHKAIVRMAKEQGLKEVCIAEDDLMWTAKDSWQYFLSNKPAEFDLYLACSYLPNELICGFHLYIISERFYDKFLAAPDNEHIDVCINDIKGDYHICRPFPALQRKGYSSNNRVDCDYNVVLKETDIYR